MLIERDILDFDINSREELKQIEKEEFGEVGISINYLKWDKLVEKTKQDIQDALNENKGIIRYIFNLGGQLITKGTAKQLEKRIKPYMHISKEYITLNCNKNKIKDDFYFTNVNHYKIESLLKAINKAKQRQ